MISSLFQTIARTHASLSGAVRRPAPFDERYWHKWSTNLPVRTLNGGFALMVWRRRRPDGSWEYRPREETHEEWLDRW